ncbi:MAG: anaerobic ribonucleoside-triphosphate reductase activating protein [Pseudomonadota bacterium]
MRPDPECNLRVGGLTALSTTDYPGRLAAVIFCQGCPWRCAYCHNPHLLPRHGEHGPAWTDIMAFLERRRGLLDAVVFSGGEPTLQSELPDAIREVRTMGYMIGLHTAGIYPRRLRAVLPLLNWVGMDIKAPFDDYASVTGAAGSGARARECMELIIASGIDHEFRTTVQPSLLPAPQLLALAQDLAVRGVRHYALQECREPGTAPIASRLPEALCHTIAGMFPVLAVRRA